MLGNARPFSEVEKVSADIRVANLTPPQKTDPDIAIVAITDSTVATLAHRSPIDRAMLAQLIRNVDAAGPAVIGLDVLLDRPTDPIADAALKRQLNDTRAIVVVARSRPDLSPDSFEAGMLAGVASNSPSLQSDEGDEVVRQSVRLDAAGRDSFASALATAAGKPASGGGRIPYGLTASGALPFWIIPADTMLQKREPSALLRGKIALIGGALSDQDQHATPLRFALSRDARTEAGVVIHAFQTRLFLDGGRSATPLWIDVLLALVAALAAASIAASGANIGVRLVGVIGIVALTTLAAFAIYARTEMLTNMTAAGLSAFLAAGSAFALDSQERRRRATEIRTAFQRFLSPSYVDALIARPELVAPGATTKDIAVLMTDLAGFTTFVDRAAPDEVVETLNTYLGDLVALVVAHGGTVDKIVGDSVHALFGAPIDQADAAGRAARCAIAIDRAFNVTADRRFGLTRVGVSYGAAMVGNFGGLERLDYTAHGSVVNIAARLEQAAKIVGVSVLATRALVEAAGGSAGWKGVGELRLRGIDLPVDVMAPGAPSPDYDHALHLIDKDPPAALALFRSLAEGDPLAEFQVSRLSGRLQEPLG